MPKQCSHIKGNGVPCRAYRLWKEDYCVFHRYQRTPVGATRRAPEPRSPQAGGFPMPSLTDAASIQAGLSRVLDALGLGTITAAEANALLAGLRLASSNLKRIDRVRRAPRRQTGTS